MICHFYSFTIYLLISYLEVLFLLYIKCLMKLFNSNDLLFNENFNNSGITDRNLALNNLLIFYAKFKSLKQSKNRGGSSYHLLCRFIKDCS
jgi:hypothetical protein